MALTPGQTKENVMRMSVVTAFVDLCKYKRCHEMGYTAKDRELRVTVLSVLELIGRFDDSPWSARWYRLIYKMSISLLFQPIAGQSQCD